MIVNVAPAHRLADEPDTTAVRLGDRPHDRQPAAQRHRIVHAPLAHGRSARRSAPDPTAGCRVHGHEPRGGSTCRPRRCRSRPSASGGVCSWAFRARFSIACVRRCRSAAISPLAAGVHVPVPIGRTPAPSTMTSVGEVGDLDDSAARGSPAARPSPGASRSSTIRLIRSSSSGHDCNGLRTLGGIRTHQFEVAADHGDRRCAARGRHRRRRSAGSRTPRRAGRASR